MRAAVTTDGDSILHPRYGWQEVDRGLSWRKLRLFYGPDHRRPGLWRVLFGPIVLLYSFVVFLAGGRGLGTYALGSASVLVAYWCVRPVVGSLIHCWQATGLINSPPRRQASSIAENLLDPQTPPTRVVDDHLAISAPVLSIDRSVTPQRIYTTGRPGDHRWLGTYNRIGATDQGAIVHQLGPLLRTAQTEQIPIEHLLATHELHELAHWALEDENEAVHADHAQQWNERLSTEIRYVAGDESALWDGPEHEQTLVRDEQA